VRPGVKVRYGASTPSNLNPLLLPEPLYLCAAVFAATVTAMVVVVPCGALSELNPFNVTVSKSVVTIVGNVPIPEELTLPVTSMLPEAVILPEEVILFTLILPEEVINLPKLGCFNVHASLLPRWRGAAPIQRAMIEGDQTTGVTIMKMDKGLDTGDIGLQKEIKIEQQNYSELEKELANEGAKLLINFIDRLDGSIQFAKQNDTQACYAKKIQKQEALIDWTENAEKINRRINAYNPSPCAWFSLNNKRIKILKAEVIHEKGEAGKIMNEEFLIGCGINSIRPLLLRVEGKQDCTINDFLLGHKIEVGSYIQ